ncbi:hypothetical protein D3C73_1561550 [compost metagenome]
MIAVRTNRQLNLQDAANAGRFQLFGHAFDLLAQDYRIPQGIGAGCETLIAFVDTGHYRLVVGFNFVRRIDEDQPATGDGW